MRTESRNPAAGDLPIRFDGCEIADAVDGVGITDAAEGLWAIHRPDCAAAIWRRRSCPSFQAWVDGLAPEHLPSGRVTLPADTVGPAVRSLCECSGAPDSAMRASLIDDIAELATLFAGLMDAACLKLRLEAVDTNACSRFHVDAVTARLICTYRGTGTQYGVVTEGEAPRRVFNVPTGAPIVVCGTLWPQSPSASVVHRSPPIEGTGETRLVLVLDPVVHREEQA